MPPRQRIIRGDCIAVMRRLPANSVHAIVTDPPYNLTDVDRRPCLPHNRKPKARGGFMGKTWDATGISFDPATWREALRVLKPGGHLLCSGGTRTFHRLASAIEDAGFEIRDCIMWLYGSGFPKSLDVSKAIDMAAGVTRKKVRRVRADGKPCGPNGGSLNSGSDVAFASDSRPSTLRSRLFTGYGTALKPAYEPIIIARKPLDGTVAQNVLKHGTGGLNVDACRILAGLPGVGTGRKTPPAMTGGNTSGRWPANICHDGSAARFFYCAKTSRAEREMGLKAFGFVRRTDGREKDIENPRLRTTDRRNHHPTVKPLALMRWLLRLVTPPASCNPVILDPFAGSGSTLVAARQLGLAAIGIEQDVGYCRIARARIKAARRIPH